MSNNQLKQLLGGTDNWYAEWNTRLAAVPSGALYRPMGQAWGPRPQGPRTRIWCSHAVLVLVALYFTRSSSSRTGVPVVPSQGQHMRALQVCVICGLFLN